MPIRNRGRTIVSYAVAITSPMRESRVAGDISALGFSVFYPRVRSLAIRRGRRVYRTSPMFPRYVLVQMCKEIFDLKVDYLIGFIRTIDRTLALVQDQEIKKIRDRCSGDDIFTMSRNARFLPGELVRPKSGAFVDQIGKFESSIQNKELATFYCLGRETIISFKYGELIAA